MELNIDYVEKLATRFLPLSNWGFVESVRTVSTLIYNSQWCRLRFDIDIDWHNKYLIVSYGRLHAVDDGGIMKWRGEDCYCWQPNNIYLRLILQFLDGLTPEDASKASLEPLKLFKDFETSLLTSHPEINSIELVVMRQAMIWEHYGMHFFELFDLRHPDLWDDYIDFLKKYFRLEDEELDASLARQGQKRTSPDIPPYRWC
jgi:hypothetical protein